MMAQAGYQPGAASEVWKQLIEERQRSALMRDKKFKADKAAAFSTHPPEQARMQDLLDTAKLLQDRKGPGAFEDGAERWQTVMRPYRAKLLEEQIRLNDPGASLYLLEGHAAHGGWDGQLRFLEGEVYRQRGAEGDKALAASAYASAIAFEDAPAAAWKAHGYDLIKAGSPTEGKVALSRYLELTPDAADASMVRYTINQE
jgi:beta-barrel assembly-enhancing protease